LLVYAALALGAALPVYFGGNLENARGFLLLGMINALLYGVLVVVIVWRHLADTGAIRFQRISVTTAQFAASLSVCVAVIGGLSWRGVEGLHALAFGLEPFHLVRVEFGAAGAGQGAKQHVYFVWDPGWAPSAELVVN